MITKRYSFEVWLTILLAFFMQVVAFEGAFNLFRPYFILIVVCFWVLVCPHQIKITLIWFLGLCVDAITGSVIGEHAFVLTLCITMLVFVRRQVGMSPLFQQVLIIGLVCYLYAFIISVVQYFTRQPVSLVWFGLTPVISALLWWCFAVFMRSRIVRHDVL